jgi:asparagine synthase (glutamine-hydrolysing)
MCGIAGIIRWNEKYLDNSEIEKMVRSLSHRGPDGEGFFSRDNITIGHRRLAIIDLKTGYQPMSNEDDTIWITFNGEIYNFIELKEILESDGHIFKTHSDTEVIIHSYEQWGTDCVKKLRGMFAFGIVDYNKKIIFISRDSFGIKPLIYCLTEHFFAFASELSSFRQINNFIPQGKLIAIDFFLRHQYIPAPHTIYKDIFKLLPGQTLTISFKGECSGPQNYFKPEFNPRDEKEEEVWLKQFDNTITSSVKSHLISDVPVGLFLSGGIDSTIIALAMKKMSNTQIKAFCIGFEDENYSEIRYAKLAAKTLGIDLYEEIINEDSVTILPELIKNFGEPFGDSSAIPTFFVSQLAKKHVSVVLSGDGGDEFFAGYETLLDWTNETSLIDAIKKIVGNPRQSKNILRKYIKSHFHKKLPDLLEEWLNHYTFMDSIQRTKLWKGQYHKFIKVPCEVFNSEFIVAQKFDRVAFAQYMLLRTYLPYDILTKVDIASMANGLEVRPPFIDTGIFSFSSRLPINYRIHCKKGICKYLTKKYLEQFFPTPFIFREKKGFAVPLEKWFESGHKARIMLENILSDNNSQLYKWFDKKIIQDILYDYDKKKSQPGVLWLLLVLGIWLDQNPDIEFVE